MLFAAWQRDERTKSQLTAAGARAAADQAACADAQLELDHGHGDRVQDTYSMSSVRLSSGRRLAGMTLAGRPAAPLSLPALADKLESPAGVAAALAEAGLRSCCRFLVAVDFSASNEWQGRRTFGARSLHFVAGSRGANNPYYKALTTFGSALEQFNGASDGVIRLMAFSANTRFTDTSYLDTCRSGRLGSGPTLLAPVIRRTCSLAGTDQEALYHLLIVLTDAQVVDFNCDSLHWALSEAAALPLAIVLVGLGDGPMSPLHTVAATAKRAGANCVAVDFAKAASLAGRKSGGRVGQAAVALYSLFDLPDIYKTARAGGQL